MGVLFRRTFLISSFILLGCTFLRAASSDQRHLGVGVNFGGAQLDWRPSPRWMYEIRAQQGSDNTTVETKSKLGGIRVYRLFRTNKFTSPFFALETAYIEADQPANSYRVSGLAAGAIGGLAFNLNSHLILEFDMGPYYLTLKERETKANLSEVTFVGDTAIIYFF